MSIYRWLLPIVLATTACNANDSPDVQQDTEPRYEITQRADDGSRLARHITLTENHDTLPGALTFSIGVYFTDSRGSWYTCSARTDDDPMGIDETLNGPYAGLRAWGDFGLPELEWDIRRQRRRSPSQESMLGTEICRKTYEDALHFER